jgi:hypothetical protein
VRPSLAPLAPRAPSRIVRHRFRHRIARSARAPRRRGAACGVGDSCEREIPRRRRAILCARMSTAREREATYDAREGEEYIVGYILDR